MHVVSHVFKILHQALGALSCLNVLHHGKVTSISNNVINPN